MTLDTQVRVNGSLPVSREPDNAFRDTFATLRPPPWHSPNNSLEVLDAPMVKKLPARLDQKLATLFYSCFGANYQFISACRAFTTPQFQSPVSSQFRAEVSKFERGIGALLKSSEWKAFVSPLLADKVNQNFQQRHRNGLAARAVAWLTIQPEAIPGDARPKFRLYSGVEVIRGNPAVCAPAESVVNGAIRSSGFERCVIGAAIWDGRPVGQEIIPSIAEPAWRQQAHPLFKKIPTVVFRQGKAMSEPYQYDVGFRVRRREGVLPSSVKIVEPNIVRQRAPQGDTPLFFKLKSPLSIPYDEMPRPTNEIADFIRTIHPYLAQAVQNSTSLGIDAKSPPASKAHVAAFVLHDRSDLSSKVIIAVNWRDEWSYQCGCAEAVGSGLHDYLGEQYELRAVVLGSPDYVQHQDVHLGKPCVCGRCSAVLGESLNLKLRTPGYASPAPGNDVLIVSISFPLQDTYLASDDWRDDASREASRGPARLSLGKLQWLSQMNANAYLEGEIKARSTTKQIAPG